MSNENSYSYDVDMNGEENGPRHGRTAKKSAQQRSPVPSRRRSKSPQSVNGLHRRRRRKMAW